LHHVVARKDVVRIELTASPEVANFVQNQRRASIAALESETDKTIVVSADKNHIGQEWDMTCYDQRGGVVKF
jgi:hypothetical protein